MSKLQKNSIETSPYADPAQEIHAFVIESGPYTAGLALKNGTIYRFLASEELFWPLEGMMYENLNQLQTAIDRQRHTRELAA